MLPLCLCGPGGQHDGTSVLGPELGLSGLVHLVVVHMVVVAGCALLSKPDHAHQQRLKNKFPSESSPNFPLRTHKSFSIGGHLHFNIFFAIVPST